MAEADLAKATDPVDEPDDDIVICVRGLKNCFGDQVVHEGLDLDVRRGEPAKGVAVGQGRDGHARRQGCVGAGVSGSRKWSWRGKRGLSRTSLLL